METKLNDNEVKEIAQMQTKIDAYESFICTIHAMVLTKKTNLSCLVFDGTPFTAEMNRVWRYVKEKLQEDASKKDSKTTQALV